MIVLISQHIDPFLADIVDYDKQKNHFKFYLVNQNLVHLILGIQDILSYPPCSRMPVQI